MRDMLIFIIFLVLCVLGYVMMEKIDRYLKERWKDRLREDCLSESRKEAAWKGN